MSQCLVVESERISITLTRRHLLNEPNKTVFISDFKDLDLCIRRYSNIPLSSFLPEFPQHLSQTSRGLGRQEWLPPEPILEQCLAVPRRTSRFAGSTCHPAMFASLVMSGQNESFPARSKRPDSKESCIWAGGSAKCWVSATIITTSVGILASTGPKS